jgi:hypothetical protein
MKKEYKSLTEEINRIKELSGVKLFKENKISKNDLMIALEKAGVEITDDMKIEIQEPVGGDKIVTINSDGGISMNEASVKDTLIKAICVVSVLGAISCSKPSNSDIGPNNTKTEIPSTKVQNNNIDIFSTNFIEHPQKYSSVEEITNSAKVAGNDGRTQYKKQTIRNNIQRIEVKPDSVIISSNTPWIGYWKFTDECRSNNHQVMIWSQIGNNPLDGVIYSGYQVGSDKSDWLSYQLIGGKGYLLSKYKINSFNYDKSKSHITVRISSPDVDNGKESILEVDYNGKYMNISNWGGGNATQVGSISEL